MKKANVAKTTNPEETQEEYCFIVGKNQYKEEWYIDSGASSHMVNIKSFFDTFSERKTTVELADGRKMFSYGIGSGTITCINESNMVVKIKVKDVLFIPNLESNLLSVKKLTERGFKLEFDKENCKISSNSKTIAVGVISNNLYKLLMPNKQDKALATWDKSEKTCIHLWHRRLGHKDPEIIKEAIKKNLVDGIEVKPCDDVMVCDVCVTGKMKRKPFPKKSTTVTKATLELVHSDVSGPMQTVTPSGKRYVLTLIDDYSRFAVVYLLSKKEEVRIKLEEYVNMVQNQFNKKPKTLRSDRGGEYIAEHVGGFLKRNGIKHEKTSPYSPQQNGVAEKKNQDLIGMARCMLIDGNLPNKYWGEAVITSNHNLNCMLSRSTYKIPYEDWNGRRANISHVRTFGSIAYMHIPDEKRRKLDPKAKKLTFVGYEEGSKAYRLLDQSTGKIYISRDVVFVEKPHQGLYFKNFEKKEASTAEVNSRNSSNEVEIIFPQEKPKENTTENSTTHSDIEERIETVEEVPEVSNSVENQDEEDQNNSSLNKTEEETVQTSDEEFEDAATSPDQAIVEVRRSHRQNKGVPPPKYKDFFAQESFGSIQEPKTCQEARNGQFADHWIQAMDEEITSMLRNETWELVQPPLNKNIIGSKWVFKIKPLSTGSLKFKARVVARGFSQIYGQDYDEIFAPVVKQATIRLMLTIAGRQKMMVHHYDFKTAFLNSALDAELFMKQPECYVKKGQENLVCRLKKSIYGLKQAARTWNTTINEALVQMGFRRGTYDQCLYINDQFDIIYALIYVDDVLLVSKNVTRIQKTADDLKKNFELTSLGDVTNFLGIEIERNSLGYFSVAQKKYIRKVLNMFNQEEAKGSKLPMDIGFLKADNTSDQLFQYPELYQSAIGCLLYLAINTRPDIAIATSILGRRVSKPKNTDWTEVKRVIKYLKQTMDLKINLNPIGKEDSIIAYADADWAGEKVDRKSNSGFLLFYNGALVDWKSRKQQSVSLSSTEAELIALAEACQEVIFVEGILSDFGMIPPEILMYEDNQSCLKLLDCDRITDRTKHIDTKYCFLKDLKKDKKIKFEYCATEVMLADFLTKPLSGTRIQQLLEGIGME